MNKEETDLIIAEQNKSTEEILKVIDKVKAEFQELCVMRQRQIIKLEKENTELKAKNKWYSEQVCNKECAEVWGNLTKAKEVIKSSVVLLTKSRTALDTKTYLMKAEKFIKEIKENDQRRTRTRSRRIHRRKWIWVRL